MFILDPNPGSVTNFYMMWGQPLRLLSLFIGKFRALDHTIPKIPSSSDNLPFWFWAKSISFGSLPFPFLTTTKMCKTEKQTRWNCFLIVETKFTEGTGFFSFSSYAFHKASVEYLLCTWLVLVTFMCYHFKFSECVR